MESQQVGNAPQNVQVHTNNDFFKQYMQINADFKNGLSRQLDTGDVVSRIHHLSIYIYIFFCSGLLTRGRKFLICCNN